MINKIGILYYALWIIFSRAHNDSNLKYHTTITPTTFLYDNLKFQGV